MADRITRPVVRVAGGVPDGNLSNLEQLGGRLLSGSPPDVYALVLYTRARLIEDDDQDGAETAVLRGRAIEAFPINWARGAAAYFPFDITAGELVTDVLQRLHGDRTGEQALPIATAAEASEHDRAMEALREWADRNLDEGRDGLAAVWSDYFGRRSPAGTVTAWRDAPTQMIREFLLAKGEQSDDEQAEQADNAERARELDEDPTPVDPAVFGDPAATPPTGDDVPAELDDPGRGGAPVPAATFSETPAPASAKRAGKGRGGLSAVQP